jgi:DNA polymerase III subunit epsilon
VHRSFDDLGTPLHQVTFCVLDLETTGASARDCAITEVGAARFRAGERLATFQTLVDPGVPIPPAASAITGITGAMVEAAPPASAVLPSLAEFVGGSVLVGHNLRFDVSFLDAALTATERPAVALRTIDTLALARCLVSDDVDDCRLATLAHQLDLDHRPTHRALDDALATADLLHALLERAASFGVALLDDLLALPRLAHHPQAAKLVLTNHLPRSPGAYVLRDGQGRPLLVGSDPVDLRRRVRDLFSGDHQREAGPALRAMWAVEHVAGRTALDGAVAEIRLAHALRPRHPPGACRTGQRYVRLTCAPLPRLAVARTPRSHPSAGRDRYLGPLPSAAAARAVVDAVATVAADPAPSPATATTPAVDLFDDPAGLIAALSRRTAAAQAEGHYAQAAALRAQGAAIVEAVRGQRALDSLRRTGRMTLDLPGGAGVELQGGVLVRAWAALPAADGRGPAAPRAAGPATGRRSLAVAGRGGQNGLAGAGAVAATPHEGPLPPHVADELACVAAWLDDNAHRLRPRHVEGVFACPLPRLPSLPPRDEPDADAAGILATGIARAAAPDAG